MTNKDWGRIRNTVLLSESEHGASGPGDEVPRIGADIGLFRIDSIVGGAVTFGDGLAYRGGVALWIEDGETVTVTAANQWAALEITPGDEPGDDAAAVVLWTDTSNPPADHDGKVVRGLWKFDYAGGQAIPIVDARACLSYDYGH